MNKQLSREEISKQLYSIRYEFEKSGAEKVRAECRDCGGSGEIHGHSGTFADGTITGHCKPCPTCTPEYDRLMEKAREAKWKFVQCTKCALQERETCAGCNLDLTANSSLIRDMLIDMGELEAFEDWCGEISLTFATDGKLLGQAVISWKGEKG